MPVKLPTGPLNVIAELELTESQVRSILEWYVKELQGVNFTSADWKKDNYGGLTKGYKFKTEFKTQPDEKKIPQKAMQLDIKKIDNIEID